MPDDIVVFDARGLNKLVRELKGLSATELTERRRINDAIKRGAGIMLNAAVANANAISTGKRTVTSKTGKSRSVARRKGRRAIGATIRVRVTAQGITMTAGGAAAPNAAVLEFGYGWNETPQRHVGQFRHPVFGTKKWVTQDAQPYMKPAIDKHMETAAEDIAIAIRDEIEAIQAGI